MQHEAVALQAGIELGKLAQRNRHRTHDERQIGQRKTFTRLPCRAMQLARLIDTQKIGFGHLQDMRRGLPGLRGVLGDTLADAVEGHRLSGLNRCGCSNSYRRRCRTRTTACDELLDVFTGDAAIAAGTGDVRRIQAVFGNEAAHHRRQPVGRIDPRPARRRLGNHWRSSGHRRGTGTRTGGDGVARP